MKTSDIKKILANNPNAVFVMKNRYGRSTSYCAITEVIEREVSIYSNYSYNKVVGTRTETKFKVLYTNYSSGRLRSDGYNEDQAPVYGLATSTVDARQIQSHLEHWGATTVQEWVAQQDAEAKANWQARIEQAYTKQQQINAIIRGLGVLAEDEKRWDKLNDDLMTLRIETLQLISEKITSLV